LASVYIGWLKDLWYTIKNTNDSGPTKQTFSMARSRCL